MPDPIYSNETTAIKDAIIAIKNGNITLMNTNRKSRQNINYNDPTESKIKQQGAKVVYPKYNRGEFSTNHSSINKYSASHTNLDKSNSNFLKSLSSDTINTPVNIRNLIGEDLLNKRATINRHYKEINNNAEKIINPKTEMSDDD